MKKYLGILLIMIGMILIPGNVNAGELKTDITNCTTEIDSTLNKKVTTCDLVIQNLVQNLDFEGGTLELIVTPTHENTTTDIVVSTEFATLNTYVENGYVLDIKRISEGATVAIGTIEFIADSSLPDQETGGSVSFNWKSGSFEELDEDALMDVPSTSDRDATVVEINETSPYYVFVSWGAFEYTYNNQGNGVYTWEPTHETSNVVTVENVGTDVQAEISWAATIPSVEATYNAKISDSSNVQCVVDTSNGYWENGIYTPGEYVEKYYSDSTCGTEIASGTAYEPNKFYHLAIVDEFSNDSSVVLSESIANDATSFISQVKWTVNLTGGSHDDVVSAINGDKKIGTVTVTLSAPTNNN